MNHSFLSLFSLKNKMADQATDPEKKRLLPLELIDKCIGSEIWYVEKTIASRIRRVPDSMAALEI